MDGIEKKLETRLIKPTAMRMLILQFFTKQLNAVSLPYIEQHFDHADKSTIFRTLKTFEKNKLIHSIDDGSGQLKYAMCLEGCDCTPEDIHYHFHCADCQETFCLTELNVPKIDLPKNFKMNQANLVIKGTCSECGG